MKLIVGLGNPGDEYTDTRHNLGFMVIDRLHRELHAPRFRTECQALVAPASLDQAVLKLVKPQTYMNLSGNAVAALARKYDVVPEDMVIIFDDIALPFSKIRLRRKGSQGGHNGVQSIIEKLGTMNFPRLRIGIHPLHRRVLDTSRFVLSSFTKSERAELDSILAQASEAIQTTVREGIDRAMAKFN